LVKYGWQPGSPWLDVALATALWENLDNHADIVRAAAPAVSPLDAAAAPPAGDVDGPVARPAWRLWVDFKDRPEVCIKQNTQIVGEATPAGQNAGGGTIQGVARRKNTGGVRFKVHPRRTKHRWGTIRCFSHHPP
jgi:hypothetical protein